MNFKELFHAIALEAEYRMWRDSTSYNHIYSRIS